MVVYPMSLMVPVMS